MEDRLQRLEQRLAQAEEKLAQIGHGQAPSPGAPSTLTTPVRVVAPDGTLVLMIEQTQHDVSIRLFNAQGHAVASLGVDGTQAGYLAIRNAAGVLVGYLNVELAGARLQLHDHARQGGLALFGGDSGDNSGGGINVNHTGGGVSVGIWSIPEGGEVTIYEAPTQTPLVILPARSTDQG